VATFRPAPRREALRRTAALLDEDPEGGRGRPAALDRLVVEALDRRDGEALDDLPLRYDQASPDPDAAMRILALMAEPALVGYLGKLIPQKGVHHLLGALALAEARAPALIIGFGTSREWLQALLVALDRGDPDAVRWIAEEGGLDPGLTDDQVRRAEGLAGLVTFTGRLDHRYAGVVAALDVLVVPSVLDEAFGMVAAEGASAGALPLVARHSGLAEVAGRLEDEVGEPGLFSFEPDGNVVPGIAAGIDRLLEVDPARRAELVQAIGGVVAGEWTWEQTVQRLLDAARER
jgi:glycosyltransferase involved in cell wall biosynthesis